MSRFGTYKLLLFFILFTIVIIALFVLVIPYTQNSSLVMRQDKEIFTYINESKNIYTLELEVADTPTEREKGLMYRENIEDGYGMLFVFPEEQYITFWMKNTLVSLDIIFLDSDFVITTIHKNTKANQITELYKSGSPNKYVIEVKSGWAEETNARIGEKISPISDL